MNSRFALKIVKVVFLLSTAGFFLAQFHVFSKSRGDGGDGDTQSHLRLNALNNASSLAGGASVIAVDDEFSDDRDGSQRRITGVYFGDKKWWAPNADDVRKSIEDNNLNAPIQNLDRYGPVEGVRFVVVVQVHNRVRYFSKLIESLNSAPDIGRETLVIVSYDYYSAELHDVVTNITGFRVMQIFYPYSMQLYSNRFPGVDKRDCASDMTREQAEQAKCQNWKNPDKYGHYRKAGLSQIKHHWWWKVNFVFDGIKHLLNFDGWAIFLEEDHYVSPDFLYTFDYLVKNRERFCSECSVITLGSYGAVHKTNYKKVSALVWFSSHHNMGMAFNRSTWNQIKRFAKDFCTYDDYNWDWSLLYISMKLMKSPLRCLAVLGPRVFHIGDCGTHHQRCSADTSVRKVVAQLDDIRQNLFPKEMILATRGGMQRSLKPPKENGGWGDVRDHRLCMKHVIASNGESV